MKNQRQVFVLHVGTGQSIGPDDLRVMWATACESLDISVNRKMTGPRPPSHGLWVGERFDRKSAETRMRGLLMARGYRFTLTNTAF